MQYNNVVSNSESSVMSSQIPMQYKLCNAIENLQVCQAIAEIREYEQGDNVALTISVMLRHCVAGKLLPTASLISAA